MLPHELSCHKGRLLLSVLMLKDAGRNCYAVPSVDQVVSHESRHFADDGHKALLGHRATFWESVTSSKRRTATYIALAYLLVSWFWSFRMRPMGRDRPIPPWSTLFAKTARKHGSSRPHFRRWSPNGCQGRCSYGGQARIRKAGRIRRGRSSTMSDTTGPGGATHVGIDVSKERLDVCFIPEGEHFVVANNEAGIQSLLDRLLEARPTLVVLEASGR